MGIEFVYLDQTPSHPGADPMGTRDALDGCCSTPLTETAGDILIFLFHSQLVGVPVFLPPGEASDWGPNLAEL